MRPVRENANDYEPSRPRAPGLLRFCAARRFALSHCAAPVRPLVPAAQSGDRFNSPVPRRLFRVGAQEAERPHLSPSARSRLADAHPNLGTGKGASPPSRARLAVRPGPQCDREPSQGVGGPRIPLSRFRFAGVRAQPVLPEHAQIVDRPSRHLSSAAPSVVNTP